MKRMRLIDIKLDKEVILIKFGIKTSLVEDLKGKRYFVKSNKLEIK